MNDLLGKDINLKLDSVQCDCPGGKNYLSPEDFLTASQDLYDKLTKSRMCCKVNCGKSGVEFIESKWFCSSDMTCCGKNCQNTGATYLAYANAVMCKSCYQNRGFCCLPDPEGEGNCQNRGDYFHVKCQLWLCTAQIKEYVTMQPKH